MSLDHEHLLSRNFTKNYVDTKGPTFWKTEPKPFQTKMSLGLKLEAQAQD